MLDQGIENRASFNIIRYGQAWEDAEILTRALAGSPGRRFLSVAGAGDNTLAMLILDPSQIVAVDLSKVQLLCLKFRMAALRALDHTDFVELMEPAPSARRRMIALNIIGGLEENERRFWEGKLDDIISCGLAGIGKFERYFMLFRRYVLPFIASRRAMNCLFGSANRQERLHFFEKYWNNWRWRCATRLFFSPKVMGKLGRDPAFFDYAEGDLAKHIRQKVRYAMVELEPRQNPYLQWILLGRHQYALPLAWRSEYYDVIRSRIDRIRLVEGAVQQAQGQFDGFNLSDIFEYMSSDLSTEVYNGLLAKANPGARFVYWNMMAQRKAPEKYARRIHALEEKAARLLKEDKAFFYSALMIEEVVS